MGTSNPLFTQIIAGRFKGKKITLPSLSTTRASKSILKASFFNTLGRDVVGSIFVEVFAGSGSMALEALSRGADGVYCFEQDRQAFGVLCHNIKHFGVEESAYCRQGDAFTLLPQVIDELKNRFCVIYFDPPFDFRQGYDAIYTQVSTLIATLNDLDAIVCVEHYAKVKLDDRIGAFECIKYKKFGKSALSYFAISPQKDIF